jgi:hypothetical protein
MDQRYVGTTQDKRKAKLHAITKPGQKGLNEEAMRWRKIADLVEHLLAEESQSWLIFGGSF